jgi:hypothetical protein
MYEKQLLNSLPKSLNSHSSTIVKNACAGMHWKGFQTKLQAYATFVQKAPPTSHALVIDADTFFNKITEDFLSSIFSVYDCVRGQKDIVVSSEMNCWIGRYCNKDDIDHLYLNHLQSQNFSSFSPFVNSGVIIGSVKALAKMFAYATSPESLQKFRGLTRKYDDQWAITEYTTIIAPQAVALDFHQRLAGTFSIHTPFSLHDKDSYQGNNMPFVCSAKTKAKANAKTRAAAKVNCPSSSMVSYHCADRSKIVMRSFFFRFNESTCHLYRSTNESRLVKVRPYLARALDNFASSPMIYHGAGAGRPFFKTFSVRMEECITRQKIRVFGHRKDT